MNTRRRAKLPTLAKRTRLARRALLRDRRRFGAGRTLPDFIAVMRQPDARLLMAGLRMELLIKHHSIGDGIAYIPYEALGEDAPAPRSGSVLHTAQVAPQGRGKTFRGPDAWVAVDDARTVHLVPSGLPPAPINAAYWVGEDEDGHTQDGDCPLCGMCEAESGDTELVNGVPEPCGCCLCESLETERAQNDYELGEESEL